MLSEETLSLHGPVEEGAAALLLIVIGGGTMASHPLPPGATLVLGRDPACDVALPHAGVSRRHAVVRRASLVAGGHLSVEDLGSTNGVRVGCAEVAAGGCAPLQVGQALHVGPFTVVVTPGTLPRRHDARRATVAVADPTPAGASEPVRRFARSPVSVLIHGETGTGKEVLARTIHQLSGRTGQFVGINSATLSESLLESELFGHERGAFTGATGTKPGLLEIAARGTVFLDEIGDLPAALQARLLRAIETRVVYRVGGLKPVALDVRFLAATHRDLDAEVAAGRFRADLYFRLNGITLTLAPLRERRDAVLRLTRVFLRESAQLAGRPAPRLDAAALDRLAQYDWPGNVRELRTVIERAVLLSDGDEIAADAILVGLAPPAPSPDGFLEVARRHTGNVSAIARELSTSRSHIHRLAQRYGVSLAELRR